MDRSRVLFLCDGAPHVGGGHVMRALTLARALGERGWTSAFAASPFARQLLDRFAGPEIARVPADDSTPAAMMRAVEAAAENGARFDAVVVDHFDMGAAEERRLRAVASLMLVVDDLADRAHDADLLVDCNLGRAPADYAGLTGAALLLGPGFAPVRPEFGAVRAGSLARRAEGGPPRRVLVSLGLTDVGGVTGRVVRALRPCFGGAEVDVVTGGAAGSLPMLRALAAGDARFRVHVDTRAVAALMAEADLAIGAGGGSTWERATVGLPTLTLVLAPNQRPGTARLVEAGVTVAIDAEDRDFGADLRSVFGRLRDDGAERAALSRRAAALCDGRGAERTAERLSALHAARS